MAERKRGRPAKVAGGMSAVLFVRAPEELLRALDDLAKQEQDAHPGRVVSRSDIAREILTRFAHHRKRSAKLSAARKDRSDEEG